MACPNRSLNHRLGCRLDVYLPRRLDGRPARRPDYLAQVCNLIEEYLRLRKKLAKNQPHIYGRHAAAYYRDTLREEQWRREVEAALDKVYGPVPPVAASSPSIWQERYEIPPAQMRFHLRWFRQQYGPE